MSDRDSGTCGDDTDRQNKLTTPPQHAQVIATDDGRYRLRVTHDDGGHTTVIDLPSMAVEASDALDDLAAAGDLVPREFAEDLSNHVEVSR